MLKIERILCPVDFSEFSAKAYEYAHSLARHYGSKLILEHVVQPLPMPSGSAYAAAPDSVNEIYWDLNRGAEKELEVLAKNHSWNGIQPDLIVQTGLLPEAILAFAEKQAVDLIVMGTHGWRGPDRLSIGSVTEKVLRKSRCPVLAVCKPAHDFVHAENSPDPVQLRKILLCTDFSDYAFRALSYGLSLAMEYNAELTLLHVLEHVLEEVHSSTDVQAETTKAVQELDKPIPADARNWCTIKSVVRIGKPYQEIVQLALEAQTDLVILGVRGRNALDLALFGSTTHRVIQLGPCPVLAVHI